MKTLEELTENGLGYFTGYTDALADFANLLIDPSVYDGKHSSILLNYLNEYVTRMLKEGMEDAAK